MIKNLKDNKICSQYEQPSRSYFVTKNYVFSVDIIGILHVKTMFGNKGEGLLHACISSINFDLGSKNEIHHYS